MKTSILTLLAAAGFTAAAFAAPVADATPEGEAKIISDNIRLGVADDGLTLAFVTAEGETALRFEGRYAVVGEKRYETEQLGALKKDLRERIQNEIFASE